MWAGSSSGSISSTAGQAGNTSKCWAGGSVPKEKMEINMVRIFTGIPQTPVQKLEFTMLAWEPHGRKMRRAIKCRGSQGGKKKKKETFQIKNMEFAVLEQAVSSLPSCGQFPQYRNAPVYECMMVLEDKINFSAYQMSLQFAWCNS